MTGQWTVQPNGTASPLSPGQQLAGGDTLRVDGTTLVELQFGSSIVATSRDALVARYGVGLMDYGNFCADGVVEYWFTYQNPQAIGDQPRTASYGIHVTTSEATGQVAAGFEAYELTTPNQPTPRRVEQPLRLLRPR